MEEVVPRDLVSAAHVSFDDELRIFGTTKILHIVLK
jgi:hypothetical protein